MESVISSTWAITACYSIVNFNFTLTLNYTAAIRYSFVQAVEILPKISTFKQYCLHQQELVFCVRDTATLLLSGVFLHPAHFSKCLLSFGVVILMTFVARLHIYGIVSRNFILVSLCFSLSHRLIHNDIWCSEVLGV